MLYYFKDIKYCKDCSPEAPCVGCLNTMKEEFFVDCIVSLGLIDERLIFAMADVCTLDAACPYCGAGAGFHVWGCPLGYLSDRMGLSDFTYIQKEELPF